MHTYIKEKDGTYAVGTWLTNSLEYRFVVLFSVADAANAIAAAATLNGGEPIHFEISKHADYDKKARGVPSWAFVIIGVFFGALMRPH